MNRDHLVAWGTIALVGTVAAAWAKAPLTMGWGIGLGLTAMLALGVSRKGSLGPFRGWLVAALATWLLAFTLMVTLSADADDATDWTLGLPPATAAMLAILWLLPLMVVVLPYALHFRHVLGRPRVDAEEAE